MTDSCPGDCALRRATTTATSTRREFVSATVLASVGAFLTACGDGTISGVGSIDLPPAPIGGSLTVVLADFPSLATDGGIARVDAGTSVPIAVTRVSAASYRAFSMICTHAGYRPVSIVAGGFECPNHGTRFSAEGDRTGGPGRRDLMEYMVTFDAMAGTLTILRPTVA